MYEAIALSLLSSSMEKNKNIRIINEDSGEEVELSQTAGVVAFLLLLPVVIVIEIVRGFIDLIFGD